MHTNRHDSYRPDGNVWRSHRPGRKPQTIVGRLMFALAFIAAALCQYSADGAVSAGLDAISDVRVAPMVEAEWLQSDFGGGPAFNLLTPNNRPCGCVATAFISIMRQWRAPAGAVEKQSLTCWVDGVPQPCTMLGGPYNWDLMPFTAGSGTTPQQREALGTLAYDFGVASHMKWADSSGTFGVVAASALVNNFGYASAFSFGEDAGIVVTSRLQNVSFLADFRNAILASLDAGMPVAIGICNDSFFDHYVVVDGYGFNGGSDVYCHLKFGEWGGMYDKWYNLIADELTAEYKFSSIRSIVYNIHPTVSGSVISGRVFDSSGNPVANAKVTMGAQETTTNDKGIYSFRFTGKGKFTISAEDSALGSATRVVSVEKEGASVGYEFDDATGAPIASSQAVVANRWGEDLTLSPSNKAPGKTSGGSSSGSGEASAAAATYDGYLEKGGEFAGTVQVKVGKANKNTGESKVTADVVLAEDGKKYSGKGTMASGSAVLTFRNRPDMQLTISGSKMSGQMGTYAVSGSRNLFASKDKTEQSSADSFVKDWLGVVNVAWRRNAEAGSGIADTSYQGVGVTIAKKGKVKVSGMLGDGTKVASSGQLFIEDGCCMVPVVWSKKSSSVAFMLKLQGGKAEVVGLGADAKVGKPGSIASGAAFKVDPADKLWTELGGKVLSEQLPANVPVSVSGSRWTLPKAGKVAYVKGTSEIDGAKALDNPSGLKLSYKAKTGSFSGSFKAYLDNGGKLKAVSVAVNGVLVDGAGYGSALVKKVGSAPATIGAK